MTSVAHPTPRQLLRRLHTAALPKALGLNDFKAPLQAPAGPPAVAEPPSLRALWWGRDGLAQSLGITAGVAAASALVLPALAAGASLPVYQALAATATAATALSYLGTLIGLWSAQDMGHGHLNTSTSMRVMPAVATGIGLGTLLGAHVACTVAGAVALGTGLMVLGYMALVRHGICDVTLTAMVACFAAASVVSPMGWLALGGICAPCALSAAISVAGGTTVIAAFMLAAMRTVQQAPPTHLVDGLELGAGVIEEARLEGVAAGNKPPTIFNVPEEFAALSTRLKTLVERDGPIFNGFNGLCVATLYGPPGSGKTFSATGLAQSLGAQFVMCDKAALDINNVTALPEPFMNLVTLLMEAQLKAVRNNRPIVVLIDEVDALLPRADGVDSTKAFNDVAGFVLLANVLSLLASGKTHLVVLMTTNHPEKIAPLLQRISRREPIYMGAPDRKAMANIVHEALRTLIEGLDLREVPHGDIHEAPGVEDIIDRLYAMKLTGRALTQLQERAMWQALRAFRNAEPGLTHAQHIELVDGEVLQAFDTGLKALEARPSKKDGDTSYGRLDASRNAAAVDRLMADMGFKDLDPFEIIRRLSEQFLGTYVDPSQSVGLSFLTSRFYMTMAQLALLYAGQRVTKPEAQELTDVSPSAGQAFFGGGNLKGEVLQVLKKTWRDARTNGKAAV